MPVCDICNDTKHIITGPMSTTRCDCTILSLYEERVPLWIRDAPRTTSEVPLGKFKCFIGTEETLGCPLDNMYQYLIEKAPNSFESLFPRILTDTFLVRSSFAQGDMDAMTYITSPFVMVQQDAITKHGSLPNIVWDYVSTRVNSNRTTWLIRTTPVTPDAYDYSDKLARLVSSRFTTIDLR